jgi:two-component system, LytTR family, response regulator LytT
MKPIKIILAEQSTSKDNSLRNRLLDLGYDVIETVDSTRKIMDTIELRRVDIVVSEIFTKSELNPIALANSVMDNYQTPIVFILNQNTEFESIDFSEIPTVNVFSKPISDIQLKVNLSAIVEDFKITRQRKSVLAADLFNDYIFVRADYKLNRIRVMDIYYIEAKKDYITINTNDNVYTVHTTMRDIMNALPESHFIRIHRSYIVNIDRIFSIKYPDLLVENKMKVLPIGGLYRKELFERLNVL